LLCNEYTLSQGRTITKYSIKLEKALVGSKPPPGACNATAMLIARLPAACQLVQPLARC